MVFYTYLYTLYMQTVREYEEREEKIKRLDKQVLGFVCAHMRACMYMYMYACVHMYMYM